MLKATETFFPREHHLFCCERSSCSSQHCGPGPRPARVHRTVSSQDGCGGGAQAGAAGASGLWRGIGSSSSGKVPRCWEPTGRHACSHALEFHVCERQIPLGWHWRCWREPKTTMPGASRHLATKYVPCCLWESRDLAWQTPSSLSGEHAFAIQPMNLFEGDRLQVESVLVPGCRRSFVKTLRKEAPRSET